ncbi:MAG: hypothetical protein IVW54_22340 [Candidatus Binataceae bacterium]|nr:hypothetical protein [Candidatus Binataceae bacterium]
MELPEPYEYIDLHHGQTMTLRVDRYEDGSGIIHPTTITPRHIRIHMQQQGLATRPPLGDPIYNEIPVLRLFGARLDETSPAPHWDVSSKTLRADLLARFQSGLMLPIVLTLTANGAKPYKRYSVSVN